MMQEDDDLNPHTLADSLPHFSPPTSFVSFFVNVDVPVDSDETSKRWHTFRSLEKRDALIFSDASTHLSVE